jgi:hypothetical protein
MHECYSCRLLALPGLSLQVMATPGEAIPPAWAGRPNTRRSSLTARFRGAYARRGMGKGRPPKIKCLRIAAARLHRTASAGQVAGLVVRRFFHARGAGYPPSTCHYLMGRTYKGLAGDGREHARHVDPGGDFRRQRNHLVLDERMVSAAG